MHRKIDPASWRNAMPDDIAGAVLLASDASCFVTGQYISVSGGALCREIV
ncbi:MAG: SDR family oxidoreductase [Dissulfurimicrobium sp.]|nr:SDR family oxidoreductase [Dissulfurimicrobium hydrothermale]UKL13861.1 SDR family oxidoreductase [Dissulfurimicrobium hydrothermale]